MKILSLKMGSKLLALCMLLVFTACNQQDTNSENETAATDTEMADVDYIYPAETVPVSPEKTTTEQDNTDVDKNYRKMVSDDDNAQTTARATKTSSSSTDRRSPQNKDSKSSSTDLNPLPDNMSDIDVTKVGNIWWEEDYVMPNAYYNFFLWDIMNDLPDATIYTEAFVEKRKNSKDKVYTELALLERPPLFTAACKAEGDTEEMLECSNEAIQDYFQQTDYPADALRRNRETTTIVSFVVDANGKIQDDKVTARSKNGNCAACREQAVDMVKAMDNWIPARRNGKAVATRLNLPINYNIINAVRMK
jgi:TonB family protein